MSSINITTLKRLLWTSEVRMLLGITIGVFAIVGLFKIYGYWDNYRDRPLADGFTYVGRDYESGCDLFICMGSRNEALYYATDVEPEDLDKIFEKWRIKNYFSIEDNSIHIGQSYRCVNLVKLGHEGDTGTSTSACYVQDTGRAYKDLHLHNMHKKYLIELVHQGSSSSAYDLLRR